MWTYLPLPNVIKFVHRQGVTTDSGPKPYLEIAQITDPVGPAGIDPELECIVLSKETIKGGDYVNDTRRKNGLNTLEVHLIGEGACNFFPF